MRKFFTTALLCLLVSLTAAVCSDGHEPLQAPAPQSASESAHLPLEAPPVTVKSKDVARSLRDRGPLAIERVEPIMLESCAPVAGLGERVTVTLPEWRACQVVSRLLERSVADTLAVSYEPPPAELVLPPIRPVPATPWVKPNYNLFGPEDPTISLDDWCTMILATPPDPPTENYTLSDDYETRARVALEFWRVNFARALGWMWWFDPTSAQVELTIIEEGAEPAEIECQSDWRAFPANGPLVDCLYTRWPPHEFWWCSASDLEWDAIVNAPDPELNASLETQKVIAAAEAAPPETQAADCYLLPPDIELDTVTDDLKKVDAKFLADLGFNNRFDLQCWRGGTPLSVLVAQIARRDFARWSRKLIEYPQLRELDFTRSDQSNWLRGIFVRGKPYGVPVEFFASLVDCGVSPCIGKIPIPTEVTCYGRYARPDTGVR